MERNAFQLKIQQMLDGVLRTLVYEFPTLEEALKESSFHYGRIKVYAKGELIHSSVIIEESYA